MPLFSSSALQRFGTYSILLKLIRPRSLCCSLRDWLLDPSPIYLPQPSTTTLSVAGPEIGHNTPGVVYLTKQKNFHLHLFRYCVSLDTALCTFVFLVAGSPTAWNVVSQ